MRIRSLHPEQWTDPEFLACSPLARLLALALRNEADDNGAFEWNPGKLKMRLLPGDDCEVSGLLAELEQTRQIAPYEVNGRRFGIIRNFLRFQSPRKPNSKHPLPVEMPLGFDVHPRRYGTSAELVRNQCGTGTGAVQGGSGEGSGEGSGKGKGKGSRDSVKSEADCDGHTPVEQEEDPAPPPDPLTDFPLLAQKFPGICTAIQEAHPRAKLPAPGTKADREWRNTLAALVRLDEYREDDVVNTLRWLFTSNERDAEFWRRQLQSLAALRNRKPGDTLTKFGKIEEAFQNARGGAPGDPTTRAAFRAAVAAYSGPGAQS